jgi:hypothetical protein
MRQVNVAHSCVSCVNFLLKLCAFPVDDSQKDRHLSEDLGLDDGCSHHSQGCKEHL